ncbi:biotin-dependent carboxyltransferase family protein [Cellulomonas fengjieae]|uniref:Biotin-dependent carboxyltransferase family protein n=1 Tax=Cellulomonas fengjieae TaxID=2819978 RepID=A0ABS3SCE8_9CELL|nr:biotin-dependent carboxyltransferase family protein [Cellulomonas fengjieae]MBO3083424.1 biotin-dependent carboxyltransferase family protein [Cellulomonas fengjieae]MBO3101825.1 biotin-dependent carboxyltransferase family protein [Cellulomonas fengjieae]QVI65242.1 biotin-dependent carboxyltransferase family protein [Cellulomonas fengjieae]
MTAALEVVDPGLLTLVEDLGRPGWAHVGVGRSGAADPGALRLANRLVANDEGAAGLEVLLGGLVVRAAGDLTVALTGAPGSAWVDGRPVGHAAVLEVPAGAELRLGSATAGLRTYVAVRGGIDVPPVLGSRSTDQLAGLGPAPLTAGDVLPVGPAPRDWPLVDVAPVRPVPPVLPVVPGPHAEWFDDPLGLLCGQEYHVTPATNRVAVRLTGPPLRRAAWFDRRELASVGLVVGAVQVPPDGQPVVFCVDHPVTGGYPVAAVVRGHALGLLGQLRPGDPVRFVRG